MIGIRVFVAEQILTRKMLFILFSTLYLCNFAGYLEPSKYCKTNKQTNQTNQQTMQNDFPGMRTKEGYHQESKP